MGSTSPGRNGRGASCSLKRCRAGALLPCTFWHRRSFVDRCRNELERRGRPYVVLSGSWEERKAKAIAAVEEVLAR